MDTATSCLRLRREHPRKCSVGVLRQHNRRHLVIFVLQISPRSSINDSNNSSELISALSHLMSLAPAWWNCTSAENSSADSQGSLIGSEFLPGEAAGCRRLRKRTWPSFKTWPRHVPSAWLRASYFSSLNFCSVSVKRGQYPYSSKMGSEECPGSCLLSIAAT